MSTKSHQELSTIAAETPQAPEKLAMVRYQTLANTVSLRYANVDMQAFLAVLCVASAHGYREEGAVWLFIAGPASSGKTSLGIDPHVWCHEHYLLSHISTHTLLSGMDDKIKSAAESPASLLFQVGDSVLFLMPDFSSILGMRPYDRAEMASQFRQLYDGFQKRNVGRKGKALHWQGKATLIAAVTGEAEYQWGLQSDLGDRFLTIRWPRQASRAVGRRSAEQIGEEAQVKAAIAKATGDFVSIETLQHLAEASEQDMDRAHSLALVMAFARATVKRAGRQGAICREPEQESTPRTSKALLQVARQSADLFRHQQITEADMGIAERIALDSIPTTRRRVIERLPSNGDGLTIAEISELTGYHESTARFVVEELTALRVTAPTSSKGSTGHIPLTVEFRDAIEAAGLTLNSRWPGDRQPEDFKPLSS